MHFGLQEGKVMIFYLMHAFYNTVNLRLSLWYTQNYYILIKYLDFLLFLCLIRFIKSRFCCSLQFFYHLWSLWVVINLLPVSQRLVNLNLQKNIRPMKMHFQMEKICTLSLSNLIKPFSILQQLLFTIVSVKLI